VVSVDALRGFDMFWIIGGGTLFKGFYGISENPVTETIHQQLTHVAWEGFRFEDLIFPLFLFVVGAVLPFAVTRRIEQGQSRQRVFLHIVKRSAVLILLGLIFNNLLRFNFAEMRWPGVLQRIGICYFFAAVIVAHTKWRAQAVITAALLLLYWLALILIPVPGYGAGVYTPQGCLPAYIDRLCIPGRLCCYKFGDNEGLISHIPAVCTALMGALAGHWLRSSNSGNRKAAALALAGALCLIAGYAWGEIFPIIKNIWTSSYVLVAGGWSLLLLALFYWVIDVRGYKKWAFFFIVIGMNPITIYFAQRFVDFYGISKFFIQGAAAYAGVFGPLILVAGSLMVKWLVLWFLYRHKVFFKV
jgi:predicted acyltransferase